MDEKLAKVKEVLAKHNRRAQQLIPILQEVQEIYSYLPEWVMEYIAIELGVTCGDVFGAATFYAHFTLEPKGKNIIKVCDGTACHVRKSEEIIKTIEKELKLDAKNRTTKDGLFTFEIVACLGACGLAPVIVVNEEVHGAMNKEKTIELLGSIKAKEAKVQ